MGKHRQDSLNPDGQTQTRLSSLLCVGISVFGDKTKIHVQTLVLAVKSTKTGMRVKSPNTDGRTLVLVLG